MKEKIRTAVLVGTAVTTILLATPSAYQYAPIVGGTVIGAITGDFWDGGRAGALVGVGMAPIALVLTASTTFVGAETGITVLVRSMEGMGPKNAIFYATVVYFSAVYIGLTGGLFGAASGYLTTTISRT